MSTRLIISPPATGKTSKVIEHLLVTLHEHPMAQVWVVLPGRLHAAAFQRKVAINGGALGAHIGTFGDIFNEILDSAGKLFPTTSATITHQLTKETVEFLSTNGKIPHLDPIRGTSGFLQILRDRFAELKRALILPEDLLSIIDKENPTLFELSLLYNEYQKKLRELNWADPEGPSWLALEALETNQSGIANWDLLGVDGFDAFTPVQIRTLQLLAPRVSQLIVTLPGDRNMTRSGHQRFRRTLDLLTRGLEFEIEYIKSSPHLPQPLLHLEQYLFEPQPSKYPTTTEISKQPIPRISMLEASSPAEEVRESFRWIKALILRYNLSPNDCAIFTADIDTYRSHLHEVATEFGLLISPSWGEPLSENPAIKALNNLLELSIRDYPYRLTLDTIRSQYFDLGTFNLTPKDAHALELVSRTRLVVGGEHNWIQALNIQALQANPEDTLYDASNLPQDEIDPIVMPYGEGASLLRFKLEQLFNGLTPPASQTLRKWVKYLNQLLEKTKFYSHCEKLVGDELISILNDLFISESLIGEHELNYQSFISTLQGALEGGIISSKNDPTIASIFLGQIIEARSLRYKAVALLGLAEGLFPAPERADPFINEKLRAEIGLEPNIGRHQNGLFYQAVTRADQYLYLSRPYLAKDGEPWEPSYYWTLIRNIFPESISRVISESDRSLSNAASKQEALFWTVRQGESPKRDPDLIQRNKQIKLGRKVLQSRLVSRPQSAHEGDLGDLSEILTHDYGNQHIWSASRLESYSSCPYLFFVTNMMALEDVKPPELGFDPAQRGTMYHAILEDTFKQAKDPSDKGSVVATLREVAGDVFRRAPEHYGFKPSALWEAEKDEMLARLEKTVEELIDSSQGWRPYKFEQPFGKRSIPALELETESGTIRISGFIDRIDKQANNLRIIDYKTGSSDLPKKDLLDGRLLQLPVYGLAAQKALNLGETTHGFYWRINAAEPSSLKLDGFEYQGIKGPQAAYEVAIASVTHIVKSVKKGEFPPLPAKGECPSYCPAASWCWRYKPVRF